MHWIVLVGTLAFALGCIVVPLLRVFVLHVNESHKPVSDDLSGPYHWFATAGFAALALALGWMGYRLHSGASWLAYLTALGVFGAMVTDSFRSRLMKVTGWDNDKCEQMHLHSAAVAFVGAFFLELALAHGWLWLGPVLYLVAGGGVRLLWPKNTAWQEWALVFAVLVFLTWWSTWGAGYV